MLPVMLRLDGRLVVVVGGGPVGRRRAALALEAGALVRLVALEPRPSDERSVLLEWLQEPYRCDHLDGAALVLTAATPAVDRQVLADAQARGVWASSATDPEAGDLHVAAHFRRGPLLVALSTGGLAPALAGALRRRLEKIINDSHGPWLEILAEVRPWLRQNVPDPALRARLWQNLCGSQWLTLLRREGAEETRRRLWLSLSALAGPPSDPL